MDRVLGVIPARYASSRFPGKPLATLGDQTMIEAVWRRARSAQRIDRLVVATDDERIVDACRGFGAEVMLTDADHASGTDRVAEVARRLGEHRVVVNVQGDEPLLTPACLDRLVAVFDSAVPCDMATPTEPIETVEELFDPNVVKVVVASDGRALYFSRSAIPFHREGAGPFAHDFRGALAARPGQLAGYRRHQGLYAYTSQALQAIALLGPSPLELDEALEQLRPLEAGFRIMVIESDFRSQAVDTPADLERVARLLTEAR